MKPSFRTLETIQESTYDYLVMLTFHNTLTRQKEPFKPLKKGVVTMYNCGPTVYGNVHIGNLRSFVFADLLRRYLEFKRYEVTQVMNITDVGHMLADADEGEDKMEVAAKKEGRTPEEVAAYYTKAFFRDIDRLNFRRALKYPKATEHVEHMIVMIRKLLENGHAYKVGKNVYFDVSSFENYGQLSGNTIEGLDPGARVKVREEKKHPADFALWIHDPAHLMQWEAPWGKGYPGWHIECSAMAKEHLGETIDIHTGGEDNKFPHHEGEIAQSEGASGKPFVKTWLHATHLLVDGEKMSKSKGNVYTLDDLGVKGFEPREVRYLLMSTHYRQTLNFTLHGLVNARAALARLDSFSDSLASGDPEKKGKRSSAAKNAIDAFENALDDDLNIAEALAAVFDFVRITNERIAKKELTQAEKKDAIVFLEVISDVLGFSFGQSMADSEVPPSVMTLIEKRDQARAEKRFVEADRIRGEIIGKGYAVEDTPDGRRIKRI